MAIPTETALINKGLPSLPKHPVDSGEIGSKARAHTLVGGAVGVVTGMEPWQIS